MGKVKYILFVCTVFIITSCTGLFYPNNIGNPIRFGTSQQHYPKTRTSYSQEYDGRIDWNEGDTVVIYMDWKDESGYAGIPRESGIYEVYGIHSNERESHGRIKFVDGDMLKWKGDFSGNDGRAQEFPHTFWSVYPHNTKFENGKFEFSLPYNQSNINDVSGLGLAAYEKDMNSAKNPNSEGYVELHYYPMFTTLCVTIDNEANFQIGDSLKLSSNNAIAGNYTVDITKRYNGVEGGDITVISSKFNVGNTIIFFIIPREYEANKLYFLLGAEQKLIPEALHAGYKYNIKITTKEVEVEPGLPPVYPDGLSTGACQFLMGVMESLQEVFRALLGDNFINNRYNGLRNLGRNITAEDFYQYLTEEDIIAILTYFQTCSEIELKTGNHLNSPITADDFLRIIPSCQILTIRAEQETEYWFKDLKLLHTIKIEGNGKVIIHADGCSSLTNVTWWDSHTKNGSGIYINGEWHSANQ